MDEAQQKKDDGMLVQYEEDQAFIVKHQIERLKQDSESNSKDKDNGSSSKDSKDDWKDLPDIEIVVAADDIEEIASKNPLPLKQAKPPGKLPTSPVKLRDRIPK